MLTNVDPYPQIEVLDFVRLKMDFVDRRIGVKQYQHRHLAHKINEEQLRERVSTSLERLNTLGYAVPDP
jgi:hypothetical protein